MSIVLSFSVCQSSDCGSLVFNDLTGAYDAGSNTTGYGAPNDTIASASSTLVVTLADGTSTTLVPTGFPTVDKTKEFTITAADLGLTSGTQIADQIIDFEYIVITDQTNTLTQNISQAFYCQVNCCVTSLFIDLDIECEDCMTSAGGTVAQAYIMLKGLEYSAACGNTTAFNKTLTLLQKLCTKSTCASCN